MINLYKCCVLILIWFIPNSFADIATTNLGEQAMIHTLRSAIDANPCLKHRTIIIGAGINGCNAFKNRARPGTINILLTWQWLDEMKNLAPETIVVLPLHALDNNFKSIKNKTTIITIDGVLHSRTVDNVKKENANLIDPHTALIFMLAGDTQQADGSWKLFTPKMASKLISYLPTNKNILFLNGPRTGKYKNINGVITAVKTAHQKTTDEVTQFIIDNSLLKPWKVVDFKLGQPSLWGPALKYCLENPQVILVIPGESTSMISEALSIGIRPAIYKHSAMTTLSEKYVNILVKQKRATLYPKLPTNPQQKQLPEPQENKIVKILCKIFQDKN